MLKAFLSFCGTVGFLLLIGLAALLAEEYLYYSSGPLAEPADLLIPPSTSFTAIAESLSEHRVIAHPLLFEARVFASGASSRFKAGEYLFPAGVSAAGVAAMMEGGKTVIHRLTIPEGLIAAEIVELVKLTPDLEGDVTFDVREGAFLPETYHFSRGDRRNDLLERMRHAMDKALTEAWSGRADGLPFNDPLQALTLASIVEKETGLASERPHVASVYLNRLKKGMLLQADPTVAYAVTRGRYKLMRPLRLADLEINSPYNTYKYLGLPPGPIANPGRASILAVLHPLPSDDLYFVATGTGGHNFARTTEEHEANVKRYRQQEKRR